MWKHKESKWLVRGGRKVRCYLCGKKILAKGDPFLFHGDTGYYSHQSCQSESTTISGNERRRAVKKIAVGAAVVGAIAAGAGKLIDISSQSKGSNSPAAQTILTSQGLIPPALTSNPANPVPGQMWYRSDAGVMAHFDGVQNRVIYSNRIVNGSEVVSAKGIVNGLSVLPNDGQDWGPDTTEGATAPGQYGSPYTETTGIQDALTYLESAGGALYLKDPAVYLISKGLTYTSSYSLHIQGCTSGKYQYDNSTSDEIDTGTIIRVTSSYDGSNYMLDAESPSGSNLGILKIENVGFVGAPPGSTTSIMDTNVAMVITDFPMVDISFCALQYGTIAFDNSANPGGPAFITNCHIEHVSNYGLYLGYSTYLNDVEFYEVTNCINNIGGIVRANNIFVDGWSGWIFQGPAVYTISNVYISDATSSADGVFLLDSSSEGANVASNIVIEVDGSFYIIGLDSSSTAQVFSASNINFALYQDLTEFVDVINQPPSANILFTNVTLSNPSSYSFNLPTSSSSVVFKFMNSPQLVTSPTISANPPVSGTAYQNTNPYDIRLKIPVTYSPTSSAAATLATGTSTSSTVTTSTKVSYPAGITTGIIDTYEMVVPAGQYFELVVTNATIGTVEIQAA